jgi:hypothetical protein
MQFRRLLFPYLVTLALIPGCTPDSKDIGETLTTAGDSTGPAGDSTGPDSTDGTSAGATTSTTSTGGHSGTTGTDETTGTTGTDETTGTTGTDETTGDHGTTGADSSTGLEETTGEPAQFDRFTLKKAAGPCPPESDCDGFVELLSTGTLRVEKFGDVGDAVTEVEISAEDLEAAVAVFADPALVAVLDGPDPLCDPPPDVFESMELVLDGELHDATTTICPQPPLQAARDAADALRSKYVP